MRLRPGQRLRSAVCDAEVVVVRAPAVEVQVGCGGAPGTGPQFAGGASALAYVGTNGLALPIGLFAAAAAGVPFVPLNYRLGHDQLHDLLVPLGDVVAGAEGTAADALT